MYVECQSRVLQVCAPGRSEYRAIAGLLPAPTDVRKPKETTAVEGSVYQPPEQRTVTTY